MATLKKVQNKDKDKGIASNNWNSYCGAFTCYKEVSDLEAMIYRDYANTVSVEKAELN